MNNRTKIEPDSEGAQGHEHGDEDKNVNQRLAHVLLAFDFYFRDPLDTAAVKRASDGSSTATAELLSEGRRFRGTRTLA
jgi:hypothetical protein